MPKFLVVMLRRLAPVAAVLLALSIAGPASGCDEVADEETALASGGGGVPLDTAANRSGIPTSGSTARGDRLGADDSDSDEPKDYWADIAFDRSNFEEVRNFVRERYIEARVDEGRAYSQAASFALASDEDHRLMLVPESFHEARKANPDEKGRLSGKVRKLRPSDLFVVLEEVEIPDDKRTTRLSDDEIRELRRKDQERTSLLESSWRQAKFSAADFDRVMAFASKELGKHAGWSMKKAWVSAAQGYLYSLDPHSSLIAKQAWEDSTKEITDSSFEGIGAILTRRPDSEFTIVESPLEGQPAVKAGLRAGDVITKVDDSSIKGWLLPKVVGRIRGKKGTKVVLTVLREGYPDQIVVPIIRSHIELKNVRASMVHDHDDLGYIKVNGFVPTTDRDLERWYEQLTSETKAGRLRGLVLDLRNNSGGLLKQGIRVADRFLRRGIVVTVKNRGEADEVYRATQDETWDLPLVVLVNDGAASASEIVASAIQDNHRGIVVGDRTFGKASVQTLFSPLLRDDYYIKLTVARYYSPNGRTLQVLGVRPDVQVAPEIDGKMPLGFREENLSNHLAPLDSDFGDVAPAAKAANACALKQGVARKIWKADPNPAVKFDYQLMYAADLLECMIEQRAARGTTRP